MAVRGVVTRIDESSNLLDVVRVRKVNNVDGHIVTLEALAEVLALLEGLSDGVSAEGNDPLALRFVHSVLERQLGHLDG